MPPSPVVFCAQQAQTAELPCPPYPHKHTLRTSRMRDLPSQPTLRMSAGLLCPLHGALSPEAKYKPTAPRAPPPRRHPLCPLHDELLPLDASGLKHKQLSYSVEQLQKADGPAAAMAAMEALARWAGPSRPSRHSGRSRRSGQAAECVRCRGWQGTLCGQRRGGGGSVGQRCRVWSLAGYARVLALAAPTGGLPHCQGACVPTRLSEAFKTLLTRTHNTHNKKFAPPPPPTPPAGWAGAMMPCGGRLQR